MISGLRHVVSNFNVPRVVFKVTTIDRPWYLEVCMGVCLLIRVK